MSSNRRTHFHRLFERILIHTRDGRGARLFAGDLRHLQQDSDSSDENFENNPNNSSENMFSNDSDSNEENLLELDSKMRRQKDEEEWVTHLRRQPRKPHVMRHLVLDFLMRASLKDAAETFIAETGIEVEKVIVSKINKLVDEISALLDQNNIEEIKAILDSIDPEILKTNAELLFELKVFSIRKTKFESFEAFSQKIQIELIQMMSDFDFATAVGKVKSPYSEEHAQAEGGRAEPKESLEQSIRAECGSNKRGQNGSIEDFKEGRDAVFGFRVESVVE